MRTAILTAVVLALGAPAAPRLPAKEIVEIRVRGHYFPAPATVPVTVAVEPGVDNHVLIVEADSEDYLRSSEIELDGDREKRLHSLELRSLPAGAYAIRAQVRSKTAVLGTALHELVVTGMTPER